MADQMRPTPRNSVLGLFSDIVNLPLQYMSSPERTQQMQGATQFLYGTGVPQTLERASYGDSLFSGAGGLGGTTRMRPETAEALMNVSPMLPAVGRLASRAVRATEGMPVGMSIKDVGKGIFEDATKYHQKVPEIKSINVDKLKRMNSGEVADVSDEVAANMDFSKPIQVSVFSDGELRIVDGHHRVAAAKKLGIKSLPVELQAINAKGATLNKLAQESTYPQQAALDLAQQRAALPVEQGGLGLPANNTAADRAKAMGFDVNNPLYHATDVDFASIRPSLQGKLGAGVYVSPSSQYAEKYTSLNAAGNARVLPLVARGKLANDDVAMNIAESIRQEMAAQNPNFSVAEWKKRTTQALANAGYAGRNMSGLESVITDPSNVRSRFAAFDPFRRDVATATAMGVALPDLLAQPVNQYQPTYETIPMYTDPFGNTIGSSIR
jgi:hypothetical protein